MHVLPIVVRICVQKLATSNKSQKEHNHFILLLKHEQFISAVKLKTAKF